MRLSWYDVQALQLVLWAKAKGIERPTRLEFLKMTWKTCIWPEEDNEEMTVPDPEVPMVYSVHDVQRGRQQWKDELALQTMGRMKKQEKGQSNVYAEEDFVEKPESMNVDPHLTKLIQSYHEVFASLPPPLCCKKLVKMDLKLGPRTA